MDLYFGNLEWSVFLELSCSLSDEPEGRTCTMAVQPITTLVTHLLPLKKWAGQSVCVLIG